MGGPTIMASNVIQQQRRRRLQQHNHHHQQQQQQQRHLNSHHHHHTRACSSKQQRQQIKNQQTARHEQQDNATIAADELEYRQQQQPAKRMLEKRNSLRKYFEETSITLGLRLCSYKLLQFGTAGLLLRLLLLFTNGNVVYGEGNVGCHFVRTLCLEGSEVCFDDNVFGKCIPTTGVDVEDIEKTPLSEDESRELAAVLEELQGAGLGWDHPYVQCRIQGLLFSLQRHTHLPPTLCANLAPIPADPYDPNSDAMAFVRFNPPLDDYVDANDETVHNLLYNPPMKKQARLLDLFQSLQQEERWNNRRQLPPEYTNQQFGGFDDRGMLVPELQPEPVDLQPSVLDIFLENELARIQQEQAEREAIEQAERKQALLNRLDLYRLLVGGHYDEEHEEAEQTPRNWLQRKHPAPNFNVATEEQQGDEEMHLLQQPAASYKRMDNREPPKSESTHRSFFRELAAEQGIEQEPIEPAYLSHAMAADAQQADAPLAIVSDNSAEPDTYDRTYLLENSLMRNSLKPFEEDAVLSSNKHPRKHKGRKIEHVFTEGGLVILPEESNAAQIHAMAAVAEEDGDNEQENAENEKAREILANMLGFTRRERLDVKKPGPLVGPPQSEQALATLDTTKNNNNKQEEGNKEVLPAHIKGSSEAHKKKKVIKEEHSDEDHAPHTVDNEYTTVFVKNPINDWNDGVRIMNELANILHMQGYFKYLTVQSHTVSFRVNSSNPEHKTAADITRYINENRGVKNNILRRQGFTVLGATVGDKVRDFGGDSGVTAAFAEKSPMQSELTFLMIILMIALIVAVIVLLAVMCYRKRALREKVNLLKKGSGITGVESCSKDYQDLCRARMAGKGNAAEPVPSGRIMSLSKDNERPPSSRSSTSSWSEEPALTNMDISTGHMVLSYMEDHLRNKGRLQREWEALCRYEAEPSARDAAQQPQCANFNRTGAPLPYDHSRVVLNHLANAEGLDYINASTITDHDPRAPAYVAAQGPLPATLAHFWQMIWEQGAVVIVSLCRLQENGDIACARYWPEEGAEVYHIYEVHLVSEHIWCDDYLVRSFYLKNLRTSETRTVTQFHFLSWPQNGVPAQAKALLDFRRKVNKSYRGRSCPIVVHGSTGAGRTGAYILLDLVLGRMNKGAREIDIAATLEHLRDQRSGLVATRQQFEFVLMAVAEEVHAILKALPANQSGEKKEIEAANGSAERAANGTNGSTGVLKEEEDEHSEEAAVPSTSKLAKEKTQTADKENAKDKQKEKEMDKGKAADKEKETSKQKDKLNEKEKEQDNANSKDKAKEKEKEKEKDKDKAKEKDDAKASTSGGGSNAVSGAGGKKK